MNKELKILAVVAFFTGLLYWGVEPYAHHQMHKKVDAQGQEIHAESHGFVYDGASEAEALEVKISDLKYLLAKESDESKKSVLEARLKATEVLKVKKEKFWADVVEIANKEGDATAGEATFGMCLGCHMDGASNMGGVIPPSLDHAGTIYEKNYLIALIKDPAMASNVDHKYPNGTMAHPMGSISSMVSSSQDIANVVAYLQKNKAGEVTPREAYKEACARCHANRYAKLTQLGEKPTTKANIKTGHDLEAMKYAQNVAEEQGRVAEYMGKLPPDLSIMIRARSEHFMNTFIEDPQSQLAGTAMPRVGLNKEGYAKVIAFLEETGDPSKHKRDVVAPWVIGFFVIFTLLAYLWKSSLWRDLH